MNKTVFFKTFRRLFGFVLAISLSASVLTAQAQNARITLNLSDVPPNFKEWRIRNHDRIQKATKNGTLPYFLKDNRQYAA